MAQPNITTAQAFDQLLNRPDLWRITDRPMQQRLNYLNKLKNGRGITIDTKEKVLAEAGYTIKQEKLWIQP